MAIEAYPLHWPQAWRRVPSGKQSHSRFDTTVAKARELLVKEIRLLGGRNLIISSNVPINKNGDMYSGNWEPDDRGVAIYFKYKDKPMCFACDKYYCVRDNLQAIAKTVEALRGIERWGASDMMERAFTGFQALPEHVESSWREVLQIPQDVKISRESVINKFRELSKLHHPDAGGSAEEFQTLVKARDIALTEITE